jgi:8-oxo-dGTP diphosphatase
MCGPSAVVTPRRFQGPALTVDAVWVADGRILLVRRGRPPFRGRWALPGGFVEVGETVENAVVRELWEETGVRPTGLALLGVYSRPGRDPRGPTVTVAFRMRGKPRIPTGGSDAREARWIPLAQARSLAFDHDEIVADALRARLGKRPGWKAPGRPGQK